MKLAGLFFSIAAGCCIISTNSRGQLLKFQEHFELYRNLWENRLSCFMTSVNTFLVSLLSNWLASSLACGKAAWYLWPLNQANCRQREQNLELFLGNI